MQKKQNSNKTAVKKVHYNLPQIRSSLVQANITVNIWGRGTGKSRGSGDFVKNNVHQMPRSKGAVMSNTYTEVLNKEVPQILNTLADFGLKEGIHFLIGKYAPTSWKWPKPHSYPPDPKHFVSFYNGSGFFMVSGDRSTSNGYNLDWGLVAEARLQNKNKVFDFVKTIRDNEHLYGHLSCHKSIMYVSDMPQDPSQRWLFDFEELMKPKDIDIIMAAAIKQNECYLSMQSARGEKKKRYEQLYADYTELLNIKRKQAVYYNVASTLDNVHVLGLDVLKSWKKQLSDVEFQTSVLSQKILNVENSFYPNLSWITHGYTAEDYGVIDGLTEKAHLHTYTRNCRWDADVDKSMPLEIGMDYNAAINCLATGQLHGNTIKLLSSMHVEKPKYLKDLVNDWCDYYEPHPTKDVFYHYDHTATADNATGAPPFYQEVVDVLIERGWNVIQNSFGQAMKHHQRYYLWQAILIGDDPKYPTFSFNQTNALSAYKSMAAAPTKVSPTGIKKHKGSERPDSGIAPIDATHMSEAVDCLVNGMYNNIQRSSSFFGGYNTAK